MFTYLDESGTLTQNDGDYFIVATYSVGDARKITKAFRKWQKTKFPKKLQRQVELKFDETLKTSLLPKLPAKVRFQVQVVDSTSNPLIQVADWVCGALARFHEGKSMGEEFYSVLKGNIVAEKELFSEKWTKTWEK